MANPNDFNIDDFLKDFDRNLDAEVNNTGNQKGSKKAKPTEPKKSAGFSVNIDRSDDFVDDEEGYIPAYNGEIYFANHTPLRKKEEPEQQPSIKENAKKRNNPIPLNVTPRERVKTRDEKRQEKTQRIEQEQAALNSKLASERAEIEREKNQLKSKRKIYPGSANGPEGKVTVAMVFRAVGIRLKKRFKLFAASVGLKLAGIHNAFTILKLKLFGKKKDSAENQIADDGTRIVGENERPSENVLQKVNLKKLLKKYRRRSLVAVACSIVLAVIISFVAISCVNDVLAINRSEDRIVTVTIPSDASTSKIIKILDKQNLIKNSLFCNIVAKVQGFRSDNYIPGVYYVTPSMGLEGMLLHFKSQQTTGETVRLTFPEGYNVDQIMEKLEKYEVCSAAIFKQTIRDVDFSLEYDFLASIEDKDQRYRYVEGYLYPDTYDFYVGENAASVIRKFLDNFNEKWTEEYKARAAEMNMSVDDVLTLASIIQKEAYGAEQMADISSVIHNRLNNSSLYPTLQCDCTIVYVTDYIEKNIDDKSLVASLTDKYSTKRCIGLPVGPICNPGNDAIYAALYPSDTKYYFFSHDKNKKLYLASNDSEHQKNLLEAMKVNEED
jgi:UPF0755 protein